ncbi:MAG: hypothetical protein FWG62_06030 [Proteobacteria bacterium]|nr:hypothetical protein [Pseudomonadota bacterium]
MTALMLGLFGMLMVAALLLMVNTGTWMSGSQKRHQTALEAAHGANILFARDIIQRTFEGTQLDSVTYPGANWTFVPVAANADFDFKLNNTGIFPNDPVDANITFQTANGPPVTASVTLVSTSRGNSSSGGREGLETNLGVGTPVSNKGTPPVHIPALYQIRAEGQSGTSERAAVRALYKY